jgi:hypothetical protein
MRRRLAAVAFGLIALVLTVAGCGTTTNTGPGSSIPPATSPSPRARATTVQVFFTRHPDADTDPTKVFALNRTSTAPLTSTQNQASYALEQLLAGPSQAERAQGYYSPFDGQLALQSVCPGAFRDFDLTLDHRGPIAEIGTATLQFCRRVDIAGDLDGPRMRAMITSTLLQFSAITQAVILTSQGTCFDDLRGTNACLRGSSTTTTPAPSGYPVTVFFSKHPDSDHDFTTVFPLTRTAPTLAVATYAVQQLIAGPTAAEQQTGYFTELTGAIDRSDASTGSGADGTISLHVRGTTPERGTATLQFCRTLHTGGIGADARITAELQATLTQFPTITHAVILTKQGTCFGDLSTQNTCLLP